MLILSEILLEFKVQEFSVSQGETFLLDLPKFQNFLGNTVIYFLTES